MRRPAIIAAAVLAVLIGVAYGASPFYAARQLQVAARNGDSGRLEELVDFPAVREHLKTQVSSRMLQAARDDPKLKDHPLATLGALLAPTLTDRIIDSVVTADGVAAIIRSGKLAKGAADGVATVEFHPAVRTSFGYQDLNHFVVAIRHANTQPDEKVSLTLTRRGLFSWQVTEINLPSVTPRRDSN
jgi:hypothetical protein